MNYDTFAENDPISSYRGRWNRARNFQTYRLLRANTCEVGDRSLIDGGFSRPNVSELQCAIRLVGEFLRVV